jgi:hypothetical protein
MKKCQVFSYGILTENKGGNMKKKSLEDVRPANIRK